jgi:hypothetical protein
VCAHLCWRRHGLAVVCRNVAVISGLVREEVLGSVEVVGWQSCMRCVLVKWEEMGLDGRCCRWGCGRECRLIIMGCCQRRGVLGWCCSEPC